MNKEQSTTKWGRVYVNEELITKLREIWLNSPIRERKIAPGVAYTVYPNGMVKQSW